jgi:HSP20 family protein
MSDPKQDPVAAIGNNIRDTIGRVVNIATATASGIAPAFDLYKVEGSIRVESAPIDGLDATSVEVSMSGKELTISGKTVDKRDIPKESFLLHGRSFGAFTKTLVIGVPVRAQEAKARVKNGTLTITLPLETTTQSEIIDIQVADD